MNHLAHIYLSGNNKDLAIGNFIADHIKGNKKDHFPHMIRKGIKMHRQIDHFTDNHPIFKRSRKRLQPKYHHYANVIIDMYFDHFLSANWSDYSDINLNKFAANHYGLFLLNYPVLPRQTKVLLPFMIISNWLVSYSNLIDLERRFEGLATRTKFNSKMEHAVDDLRQNYKLFEQDFKEFFPYVMDFSKKWINENI